MIATDETLSGQRVHSFRVDTLAERLTVREIIRARIWQEVQEYNARGQLKAFKGLVQPTDAETRLNEARDPNKAPAFKPVSWEKQYETALRAFETNGFFILVHNRQAERLDEQFDLEPETEVSFVKLVPLVGG
jgi:hypothetical protein